MLRTLINEIPAEVGKHENCIHVLRTLCDQMLLMTQQFEAKPGLSFKQFACSFFFLSLGAEKQALPGNFLSG